MKKGRNEPCRCGSGRKFKKCCLPAQGRRELIMEETKNHVLKNDFGDELEKQNEDPIKVETEKVGAGEMMKRDMFVTMRQLQVQRDMQEKDCEHSQNAKVAYGALLDELKALPLSEAQVGMIMMIEKQVAVLEKQIQQSAWPRVNEVTLTALEIATAEYVDEAGTSGDMTAPELADDDLDDDDEDLDDDDPNEAV